jgi:hypothetical protein
MMGLPPLFAAQPHDSEGTAKGQGHRLHAGHSAVWQRGSFGYFRSQVRILLPRPMISICYMQPTTVKNGRGTPRAPRDVISQSFWTSRGAVRRGSNQQTNVLSKYSRCAEIGPAACSRARAFRFSSLAFGSNVPSRELSCVEPSCH